MLLASPPRQDLSWKFNFIHDFVADLLHHVQIALMVDFMEADCNLLHKVLALLLKCIDFLRLLMRSLVFFWRFLIPVVETLTCHSPFVLHNQIVLKLDWYWNFKHNVILLHLTVLLKTNLRVILTGASWHSSMVKVLSQRRLSRQRWVCFSRLNELILWGLRSIILDFLGSQITLVVPLLENVHLLVLLGIDIKGVFCLFA